MRIQQIIVSAFISLIILSTICGQEKTAMSADQTLRSNGRVNPSTLGMELNIPLAAYPGRGSGASINLAYSSKLWRMEQVGRVSPINSSLCRSLSIPRFAELSSAGWTSDLGVPYIEYTGKDNQYDESGKPINTALAGFCQTDTAPQEINHVRRITVHLPGGGTHELRASSDTIVTQAASTYNQNNVSWNALYYSADGSNLIYREDSANAIYRLYLTDGASIDFGAATEYQTTNSTERTIRKATISRDRNGNKMTYHAADSNHPNGYITDTMGRVLDIPVGLSAPETPTAETSPQQYTVPGLTGAGGITYGLHWRRLEDVRADTNAELCYIAYGYPYPGSPQPPTTACKLFSSTSDAAIYDNPANGVFNPIVLARIDIPNGSSYKFKYDVRGRIERIEYPTGGIETFDYSLIPVLDPKITMGAPDSNDLINYGVTHREVVESSGATPIEWNYSAEKQTSPLTYKVTTNAPDGTKSESYLKIEYGSGFGFDSPLNGMPYDERSFDSTPALRSKKLTTYQMFGTSEQSHPRATRIENIIYELATSQALSASVETSYAAIDSIDDPLLAASTAEYAFTTNIGNLGALQKITEIDYLSDSNYAALNLRSLPVETRIKDANGNVKAKSQISYDESSYALSSIGTMPSDAANSWTDPLTELGITLGSKRGLPTTVRSYSDITVNPNLFIETHSFYDQYGNIRKVRDGRGNDTEIQYSAANAFAYPTKTITPVPGNGSLTAFEATVDYDYDTGLPTSTKDANNLETRMEYNDPLLRPTKVQNYFGGQPIGAASETIYGAGTSAATRFIKSRMQIDAANWKEGYSWFDGLGRTTKSQSVDSNGDVFALTCYDPVGRVLKTSNPFRNVSSPNCASTNLQWTTNTYDAAGRVWKVTTPDNAFVETNYGLATSGNNLGTVVTVTDQAGKQRRSVTNTFGQLERVDEPFENKDSGGNVISVTLGSIASPAQPTDYNYDLLNNLTSVSQGAQTRSFAYDSLSRLKSANNPESGVISYQYDNNGNLTKKTDARLIETNYSYDTLNRVVSRSYANEPTGQNQTPTVAYYYDGIYFNAVNQQQTAIGAVKGKLTSVSSLISRTNYSEFDAMGRVLKSQQITDGAAYPEMTYTYNLSGALIEQKYPSGRVVKNVLDVDGDLSIVQSKKNQTAGFWNYAENFTYTAAGAVSSMQLGNGRWESTAFNTRLQPIQIALGTVQNGTDKLRLNFTYNTSTNGNPNADNNGNILSQTITVPTEVRGTTTHNGFTATQTYTYDSLNRIKQATETVSGQSGNNWQQTFEYDRFGNRTFNEAGTTASVNFPKACGGAMCAAVKKIFNPQAQTSNNRFSTADGYQYDSAGNTIRDAQSRKFTYDGENKQTKVQTIDSNGNVIATLGEYFYDGDGKRVKKYVPGTGETTVFVYDAAGKLVAENSTLPSQTQTVSYLTSDHLGSPRINTDANGNVTARHDYQPFGEEITRASYGADTNRKQFTSYERDNESELDFAEARYYNLNHGRFNSVDPLMASADISSPQTFNRYSYVMNNPLNLTDPTGMKAGCPEGQKCETDDQGNEYYLDAAGKVVYTSIVGAVVTVGTKEAVKEIISEPFWEMVWYKAKKGTATVGRITGKGLFTVARGAGVVLTILTNPTSTGCAGRFEMSDGNGGCARDNEKYEEWKDSFRNPNPEDNKPNTEPELSKGGDQNKKSDEFKDESDEDVTKGSKDKSLPKDKRERYKTEDKARKNRNKKKRGNK